MALVIWCYNTAWPTKAPAMNRVFLINVTGADRPGITARICTLLAAQEIHILDIGQAVIHDQLAWGLLVDSDATHIDAPVFQKLKQVTATLGLNLAVTEVSSDDYENWVNEKGQPRHIITLLGASITPHHMAQVASLVSQHALNIDQISRLSSRQSLQKPEKSKRSAIDILVRGPVRDLSRMHADFLTLGTQLDVDIAVQRDDIYRRNRRLVCFDMDSTLIQDEVIDLLAKKAGVGDTVSTITDRCMRGELDFDSGFKQRLRLLKGLPASCLPEVAAAIKVTPGARRLIHTLKKYGYKVVIISGGFDYFANHLKNLLHIDYTFANELDIKNGILTGKIKGDIVNKKRKSDLLRTIAKVEGISLDQVIAVGDGANDLDMLSIAGLGIAFQAKPVVSREARYAINSADLDSILYLLGMRDRDIESIQDAEAP